MADDSISWGGLVGATLTVLVTTLDDSVWLLPFVGASSLSLDARLVHAGVFLLTLEGLAIACCLVAVAIRAGFASTMNAEQLELKLELVAVLICWALAAGFFLKKLHKKRQRHQRQEQQAKNKVKESGSTEITLESFEKTTYGSVSQQDTEEGHENDEEWQKIPSSQQPWTVVTLTSIGFLDEISYFPALIVGNVFSVSELCIGTLLAGLLMLCIQVFLAKQCKPLIDFLDNRVPLYGIIALFATILTLHWIWDAVTTD
jgi:membrane protein implicated in regulation of membrane protease activity